MDVSGQANSDVYIMALIFKWKVWELAKNANFEKESYLRAWVSSVVMNSSPACPSHAGVVPPGAPKGDLSGRSWAPASTPRRDTWDQVWTSTVTVTPGAETGTRGQLC